MMIRDKLIIIAEECKEELMGNEEETTRIQKKIKRKIDDEGLRGAGPVFGTQEESGVVPGVDEGHLSVEFQTKRRLLPMPSRLVRRVPISLNVVVGLKNCTNVAKLQLVEVTQEDEREKDRKSVCCAA
ncbi:hypothetical protein FQA39_LY05620 [Lamprigera yunnana]|nr:hypothetical protein FQA39_LY05620 [Lamprigera yunnana]